METVPFDIVCQLSSLIVMEKEILFFVAFLIVTSE
jgi:hypothetical protein